ncbi:MAG: hypothetical protein WAN93_00065 [Solirubrobacteraceae bacterium]
METPRRRPKVPPSQIVQVIGWVGFRGLAAAGVLTALLVAALHPAAPIWIATWILLSVLLSTLDMRQTLPHWFAWFRGRPADRERH